MILVLWSSPNDGGLTAACAHAAAAGIEEAGGEYRLVKLNGMGIGVCQACGDGWGTCGEEHFCQVMDGFQALHEDVKKAEGLVMATPVYWGDMSESAKCFFDRLRRCEARQSRQSALFGKPFLAVAAAGGSGNGTVSCLTQMERLASHLGMRMFDGIPVKRFTRQYQLASVEAAAAAMTAAMKE
jgi:multimeric flavodoxin WrbA